jgi:asparagine synthase (glutamine-hydrolysing)
VKGKNFIERGVTPLEERYIGNAKIFEEREKKLLLKEYNSNLNYTSITGPIYNQSISYDTVTKMQHLDILTWLKGDILLKADKMTMAHSLELRVPFLDKEVFKVAAKINSEQKVKNNTTKYILRKAAEGIVPEHVLNRKKLGFPVPMRHWLKDEMYDWATNLIRSSPTDYLFNKQEIFNLLQEHVANKKDNSRKLWTIFVFMIWHQIYIEGAYDFKHSQVNQTTKKQAILTD